MNERLLIPDEEEDDVARCRRVRAKIGSQFKSFDEMFDFFAEQYRKEQPKRTGSAKAKRARRQAKGRSAANAKKRVADSQRANVADKTKRGFQVDAP